MPKAAAPKPPAKAKGPTKPPSAKSSKLSGTRRTVTPLKKSTAKPVVVEARKLPQSKTKTEKVRSPKDDHHIHDEDEEEEVSEEHQDDDDDDGFEDVDIPDDEFEKIVGADLYADDDDDNDNGEVDDAENADEDEEDDDQDDDDDDDETGNDEDDDVDVEDLTDATLGQESSESGEDDGGDDNDVLDELAMQDAIVSLDARDSATKKNTSKASKKKGSLGEISLISGDKQQFPSTGVVYLGRIPHGFYEKEMHSYFSQFGEVLRLRLSRNKKTGASKHFAFIEFESPQVAQIVADTMHGYLLFNHILQCKVVPWEELHADIFKGWDKPYKPVPMNKAERLRVNKPLTPSQAQQKAKKLIQREQQKRKQLAELGIDYEFVGFEGLANAAAGETNEKPKGKKRKAAENPKVEQSESKANDSEKAVKTDRKSEDESPVSKKLKTATSKVQDASGKPQKPKIASIKNRDEPVSSKKPKAKESKSATVESTSSGNLGKVSLKQKSTGDLPRTSGKEIGSAKGKKKSTKA
ncbi:MKI67 FHA domain-interacting nucleolar phosphoprotein [Entophlyctis luteolus]|nr:MKI67 FHA domain-interacting nucleolar phosphoprotein [Entophlyctis luteolus]